MEGFSTGLIGPLVAGCAIVWLSTGSAVVFRRYAGHREGVRLRHLALLVLAPWRLVSDRRRAVALQAAAVAAYDDEVGAYRVSAAAWDRRRSELSSLLRVVDQAGAENPESSETVYCTVPATLAEGDGETLPGKLSVGSEHLLFEGDVRHEWECRHVEEVRHVGDERTLLRSAGRTVWSTLSYEDEPVTRLYLDLALTTCARSRKAFLSTVRRNLEALELRAPRPPVPPAPVPGLPRGRRLRAERWRSAAAAAATADTGVGAAGVA